MTLKSGLFNLKYRCFRREAFVLLDKLMRSQYWSEEQWERYHSERQKELVLQAFQKTGFYAKFYGEAGFDAGDVEQAGFFEKLPVLKKEDLRTSFADLVNPALEVSLGMSTTGGSTGVPVKCGFDRCQPVEAYGWRTLEWWGLDPSDDGGYVWRNPRGSGFAGFANQALWWPTRKIRLDASVLTPDSMRAFILKWNRIKPPQLQGYVGAVDELARFIESNHIVVRRPKVVWVTSAPLLPAQRYRIENTFGAPVYDQYGCCEVPWIAAQCAQKGGLHVNAERTLVEFVDDLNRRVTHGSWGRTLLTRYDDFVFPLIRYEVGDTGRFLEAKCACGRTLPLIDQVKGRLTDVIRLPSGRVLSGEYLTTIFDARPESVKGFRVTQKREGGVFVEFIPAHETQFDAFFKAAEDELRKRVNGEVSLFFLRVQSIPHDRGKLRFVVREQ